MNKEVMNMVTMGYHMKYWHDDSHHFFMSKIRAQAMKTKRAIQLTCDQCTVEYSYSQDTKGHVIKVTKQ